jgi:3-phenylpropionate/trans-cinnamate dioxygenase ferredoxin reductase subunit
LNRIVSSSDTMVIVGAGHAGGRAALTLRELGWHGDLVLIGAEPWLPYERPPLSKGLLTGNRSPGSCLLRPAEAYKDDRIEHIVARVTSVNPERRRVNLAGGRSIGYRSLLLAMGGTPRRLTIPGSDLPNILCLRTLDDAERLAARLRSDSQIAIIGGGLIGLEVAAAARSLGCAVSIVEGAAVLVGRSVPVPIAMQILNLHRERGVDIKLSSRPTAIHRRAHGRVGVELADGSEHGADVVVVAIGIEPAIEMAAAAGLETRNGIIVDAELATSAPSVFAAGDCAEFPSPLSGRHARQETWSNAECQGRTAARNMLGGGERHAAIPWFWSDQYDHTLQVGGEPGLANRVAERALDGGAIHFHVGGDDRLVGFSGFGLTSGMSKHFQLARLLVERRRTIPDAMLADPTVSLKTLL